MIGCAWQWSPTRPPRTCCSPPLLCLTASRVVWLRSQKAKAERIAAYEAKQAEAAAKKEEKEEELLAEELARQEKERAERERKRKEAIEEAISYAVAGGFARGSARASCVRCGCRAV